MAKRYQPISYSILVVLAWMIACFVGLILILSESACSRPTDREVDKALDQTVKATEIIRNVAPIVLPLIASSAPADAEAPRMAAPLSSAEPKPAAGPVDDPPT